MADEQAQALSIMRGPQAGGRAPAAIAADVVIEALQARSAS